MKFSEFKYQRPDLEAIKKKIQKLLDMVGTDKSYEDELKAIHAYFKLSDSLGTQGQLVGIRNSIDTTDEFYEKEQEFFDENMPYLREYEQMFTEKLLKSKHRQKLEIELGSLMFERAELSLKVFKPEIIEDLQQENKLSTEYGKLVASAKIEFDGGIYNLSQMAPFVTHKDRETRHRAQLAVSSFFQKTKKR